MFFKSAVNEDMFAAPTVSSDVVIDISGEIARVNIRQRFHNPTSAWTEGVYVFPLPEGSAVDRLTMHIGDRKVKGVILEKHEAASVFRKAAINGRHASLLSNSFSNIFTTSVANIAPGAEINVDITYQDRARFVDGTFSYRFPMAIIPRYSSDSSSVAAVPPILERNPWKPLHQIRQRKDLGHSTKTPGPSLFRSSQKSAIAAINPVSLAILLDSGMPLDTVNSPNHSVTTTNDGPTRALVTLNEGQVPADRDFILNWTPIIGATPKVSSFSENIDGAEHIAVSIVPPDDAQSPTTTLPRDIVFILDKSGSMHGSSIEHAKQAIRLAISRLGKNARFNVIAFDSAAAPLFNGLRPARDPFITRAFRALGALEADGGTEMSPPLELALDSPRDSNRLLQIVFLTDGAVYKERELFELINRRLGDARLFTVGIGPAPNDAFMRRAAESGRGAFTYIDNPNELNKKVNALLRKLERPAIINLNASWDIPGKTVPETYPVRIPDIYSGEPITFVSRLPKTSELSGFLTVSGERNGAVWSHTIDLAPTR
ncbi:MAG TPA: marine proteobacterial sortase target protein, partial [Rhodospirillaceae bacterium]|nr:marine proteobacterial sortase target protein [Rhodospirillaceae bacterium]